MNWYKIMGIARIIGVFAMVVGIAIIKLDPWKFETGQIVASLGLLMWFVNKMFLPEILHDIEWSKE